MLLKYLFKKKMHSKMKERFEKRCVDSHRKIYFLLNIFFKLHFHFSHIPAHTEDIPVHSVTSPHWHLALWQLWVLQQNTCPYCLEDILESASSYWVCMVQIACHLILTKILWSINILPMLMFYSLKLTCFLK